MHPFEITVQDLATLYGADKSVLIIDVREGWEVEKVSLKGATHLPLGTIAEHQPSLSRTAPIYVLCHYGVRSLKVALFLRDQGHEAYSIKGGIDAWAREVDASIGFY